jgi:hypothetical protein
MQNFQQQIEKYKLHEHIYTDGKDRQQSRFRHSQVIGRSEKKITASNNCIFGDVAIGRLENWEKKLILTNSLSTLQVIRNNNTNPIIKSIIKA